MLEKLNTERVPRRGATAGLGGEGASGGLEERQAQLTGLPTLALSLICQASHTLLLASFFSSVSEEIELACVHGSHPDSEILFFSFWHWIQMTKIDTMTQ